MPNEVEVHALFVDALEDREKPLAARIETIDVRKYEGTGKNKRSRFIDWVRAEDLQDETTLRDKYGAGVFELVAKGGGSMGRARILARCHHDIAGQYDEENDGAEESAAAPVPQATSDDSASKLITMMFKEISEGRRETLQILMASNENVLKSISSLAAARIADSKDMLRIQSNNNSGAMTPMELLKLIQETRDDALSMVEALQGEGRETEAVQLMNAVTEGVKAFRDDPDAAAKVEAEADRQDAQTQPQAQQGGVRVSG